MESRIGEGMQGLEEDGMGLEKNNGCGNKPGISHRGKMSSFVLSTVQGY